MPRGTSGTNTAQQRICARATKKDERLTMSTCFAFLLVYTICKSPRNLHATPQDTLPSYVRGWRWMSSSWTTNGGMVLAHGHNHTRDMLLRKA